MLCHCSFNSFLENRTLLLRHTVEKMPRKSYMYFSSHFFFGLRGGIKQEPRSDKSLKTDGLWEPLEKTIQLETTGDSIAEFSFCRCQIRWAKIAFSTLFFFSLCGSFSLSMLVEHQAKCLPSYESSHHQVPFLASKGGKASPL